MMTTQTKKKSHLNNDKLNVIADEIVDQLDDILEYFQVKFKKNLNKYYGPCPIHEGDGSTNPWNLYHKGDIYRGNWKCRSHGCEKVFKPTAIGLVRGMLSKEKYQWAKNGDKTATFEETMTWISKWLKKDLDKISVDYKQIEKKRFVNQTMWMASKQGETLKLTPEQVRSALRFPSAYFLERGYSKDILEKYDIGDCTKTGREMTNRAVIPIYDLEHKYIVGCSGRSIYKKCDKCELYHAPQCTCPNDENKHWYFKWKHNKGFLAEQNLFNLWFAASHIDASHSIILCESPGNVLRLEESGIHNSVALFGTNLSEAQLNKLYSYQIYTVNLLFDNDEAGKQATSLIRDKLSNIFNVNIIQLESNINDVGELTSQEVETKIKPKVITH